MNNIQLARLFHFTYERLAPAFGYKTRKASRVPFFELDQRNKALMLAVAQTVLDELQKEESLPTSTNIDITASPKLCATDMLPCVYWRSGDTCIGKITKMELCSDTPCLIARSHTTS